MLTLHGTQKEHVYFFLPQKIGFFLITLFVEVNVLFIEIKHSHTEFEQVGDNLIGLAHKLLRRTEPAYIIGISN